MTPPKTEAKPTLRRNALIWLGVLVSCAFLYMTFRGIDAGAIIDEIGRINVPVLCLSLVTQAIGIACMAARSRILLTGVADYTFSTLFRSVLVAIVGNNVLPLRIGELLRIGFLARKGNVSSSACLAVIVVERSLDLLCLLVVVGVAFSFTTMDLSLGRAVPALGGSLLIILGIVVALSRSSSVVPWFDRVLPVILGARLGAFGAEKLRSFVLGLGALASIPKVIGTVFWSFAYWGTAIGSILAWNAAFGLELPWVAPTVILAFMALGTLLPSTPGYVGTYHYALAYALGLFSVPETTAASYALVTHALTVAPLTIVSIPFVLSGLVRRESTPPDASQTPGTHGIVGGP